MAVTAASVNPQQLRERLLQATDSHYDIHDMVAVLDVISTLEKYPITKEALEDTRLGKLINDLRKKTRDEDLAKRAKKLLRNWQKLIAPQHIESLPKQPSSTLNSPVTCYRTQSLPVSRTLGNDKNSVLHHIKQSANHQSEQQTEQNSKVIKTVKPPGSGIVEGPDGISTSAALKPEVEKEPAPGVLRTAVLQRHRQKEVNIPERVKHRAPSYNTAPGPKTGPHSVAIKRPQSLIASDSEPLSTLPLNSECHKDVALRERDSPQKNDRKFEPTEGSQLNSKCSARLQPGLLSEVTNMDNEKDLRPSEVKRRKSHSKDQSIHLEGRSADEAKPTRVKNRKLTFDPITQQIRTSAVTRNEEQHNLVVDVNESLGLKQSPSSSSPSALHKTNWKEVSQNEIVKHYLNLQNNLLKSSGSQIPQMLLTEKHEEEGTQESSKTYVLAPSYYEMALPGLSRDITTEDIHRINSKPWPGVNGCHDSKGNWYGWTECISLDVYGDGSKLDILPYVCID